MTNGLMIFATTSPLGSGLPFAQLGGTKNFWVDLILVAVLFGGAVFVVCRASRRY